MHKVRSERFSRLHGGVGVTVARQHGWMSVE